MIEYVLEHVAPLADTCAAPVPVIEYVASSLADTCAASAPVDFSLMNEEQLAIAVAALRQREAILESLLEVEASQLGALLIEEEQKGAACAQEDQAQTALT